MKTKMTTGHRIEVPDKVLKQWFIANQKQPSWVALKQMQK